jgi:hypothetical protein
VDDERASELAWQLAQLESASGDPHVLAREAALRGHLYWVLEQSTPRRRLQRAIQAAQSGRLVGELRLQRMRQRLLSLGNDEDADLAEVQRCVFDAASYAERTWLGSGLSFETSAGLHAIEDPIQQNRFARLVRRGAVVAAGPKTLALKYGKQRRRAAYLMGCGICAWMLLVLWAMLQQRNLESAFILAYIGCTVGLAAWSTRQVLLDLKEDSAVVAAATQGLRPRWVRTASNTNKIGPQSRR